METGSTVVHEGTKYTVTDEDPKNFDLVITEKYGVWTFKDEGNGSAPLPYWANKNTCKKLVKQ